MGRAGHQHQSYCQQLLLGCDDVIFEGPLFRAKHGGPTKKMRDLEKPNSEDAVTWSIFRLLATHFTDQPWLPELLALAGCQSAASGTPRVTFWEKGYPPRSRLLWLLEHVDHARVTKSRGARNNADRLELVRQNLEEYRRRVKDGLIRGRHKWVLEGPTEFDTIIRTERLLVAVEAKLYSDVATYVRWDTGRDQIARVVDAGLELAGGRDFAFLLITDRRRHAPPKEYERLMKEYRAGGVSSLPPDRLGWLTWGEVHSWLEGRRTRCTTEQRDWIGRLRPYLAQRSLLEA